MNYDTCVNNIKERIKLLIDDVHRTIENDFVGRDAILIEDELTKAFDGVTVTFLDRSGSSYGFEELYDLYDEIESAIIKPAKSFPLDHTNAVITNHHELTYKSDFMEGEVYVEIAIDLKWKEED